jgi:hypothetical protein
VVVGPVVPPVVPLGMVLRVPVAPVALRVRVAPVALRVRVVLKIMVVLKGLVLPVVVPVLVLTGLPVGLTSGSLLPAGTPARSRPRPRGSDRFRPRRGRRLRRLRRTGSRMLP